MPTPHRLGGKLNPGSHYLGNNKKITGDSVSVFMLTPKHPSRCWRREIKASETAVQVQRIGPKHSMLGQGPPLTPWAPGSGLKTLTSTLA